MPRKSAFTLIELLVVIAIIAILASILFPVFAQAKSAAKKAAAISNFKQMTLGTIMYMESADDKYPLLTYNATFVANPVAPDTTHQLLIKPYLKNRPILWDPMNPIPESIRRTAGGDLTNPDSVPYGAAQADLNFAFTTDFGINTQFLNPIGYDPGSPINGGIKPYAITQTEIEDGARTILAIDSIWNRTAGGTPIGGGNYGVDAPCVYDASFNDLRPYVKNDPSYYWFGGWNPGSPNAWNVFGGVWPWHTNTRVVVSWTDGHASTLNLKQVSDGCDVQNGWAGVVLDTNKYLWDLR